MLRSLCFLSLPVIAALLAGSPAFSQAAQPNGFAAALSGTSHPLSLKLKDLDVSWRSLSLSGSNDASVQVEIYYALISGGAENIYYTKGETETISGECYLVAYHHQVAMNYTMLLRGDLSNLPVSPKPTPETVLSLSLLNVRSVGSLNDIHPFSLQEALNPPGPPAPDPNETSVSNLKQLGLAINQYAQDDNDFLPPLDTAPLAEKNLYPFVKSESSFKQPSTHEPYQPNTSLSRRNLASFADLTTMVIYYEAGTDPDGLRAVLFLDGRVKRVNDAEWQRLKAASHIPNPK